MHPAVGGSDVVDVNNANIRVYTRFPGMYPNIARKIVKGIPYASIDEMLQKQPFTAAELEILDKYLKNLTALEAAPEVRYRPVLVLTLMKS
jgi:photosystem II PsbU protein